MVYFWDVTFYVGVNVVFVDKFSIIINMEEVIGQTSLKNSKSLATDQDNLVAETWLAENIASP